jgi:hypothetical protein
MSDPTERGVAAIRPSIDVELPKAPLMAHSNCRNPFCRENRYGVPGAVRRYTQAFRPSSCTVTRSQPWLLYYGNSPRERHLPGRGWQDPCRAKRLARLRHNYRCCNDLQQTWPLGQVDAVWPNVPMRSTTDDVWAPAPSAWDVGRAPAIWVPELSTFRTSRSQAATPWQAGSPM